MDVLQDNEKIILTPVIVGGQPSIAGTRFTVKQIVVWHEYLGQSADEIATNYQLELSDIYAALSWYFDHRDEINLAIQAEEDLVEQLRVRYPSKIANRRG
ncbi:MAG: DUF433 domain-containing protein [Saprospiraceae bacterium]|nr:DUF433 domain-containing protein [Saprospiraceae bacterium]